MVFSSLSFLFVFLPLCLLVYFAIPKKLRGLRNGALLLFSLFFYFVGEPKYLIIMVGSIAVNYLLALAISRTKKKPLPGLKATVITAASSISVRPAEI